MPVVLPCFRVEYGYQEDWVWLGSVRPIVTAEAIAAHIDKLKQPRYRAASAATLL